MTGTTVTMSTVVRTAGPGMRTITSGYTTAGMATNGTVGGTSGPTTAMTGTTVTMSTVVGIAGPGMTTITTGYTTAGMATNGTAGERISNDYRIVTHVRAMDCGLAQVPQSRASLPRLGKRSTGRTDCRS